MRVLLVAFGLSCAVVTPGAAQRERLTPLNIALAAGSTTLILIDRGMTEHALQDGRGEWNPLIGPHPSVGRLNTYIVIASAANLAGGLVLNKTGARNFLWGTVAAFEMVAITSQISMGIPVRF